MTLWDCAIQYFIVPQQLILLDTKAALLTAIGIYKTGIIPALENKGYGRANNRNQRRKLSDNIAELGRKHLITEAMTVPEIATDYRLVLPYKVDYSTISFAGLKVYLACLNHCRYTREKFRFSCTQEELAGYAKLSSRSIRDGLRELEDRLLLKTKKVWQEPTRITMLDPEGSGVELFFIGDYFKRKMDVVPVFARYQFLLSHYDPRLHLENIREAPGSYQVCCPLCKSKDRTLQFDPTDTGDHWICHQCDRSGDSVRLWALLTNWREKENHRKDLCNLVPDIRTDSFFTRQSVPEPDIDEGEQKSLLESIELELVRS